MIEVGDYKIAEPNDIETPAMLVFSDQLDNNIRVVSDLAGGGNNLIVHVKTHKSEAVARRQLASGVAGFKCATLKEVELALGAGAKEVILAYPMAQKIKVQRFAELSQGEAVVSAIASAAQHVQILGDVAAERQQALRVMIDLDAGMHRTGVSFSDAPALYRQIAEHPHLEPGGLHIYDGHEHLSDLGERQAAAQRHIDDANRLKKALVAEGFTVPSIVGGSTFSFAYYGRAEGMCGSPGTCIYWDTGYGGALPDMPFKWAALVLTQVIDRRIWGSKPSATMAHCRVERRSCRIRMPNSSGRMKNTGSFAGPILNPRSAIICWPYPVTSVRRRSDTRDPMLSTRRGKSPITIRIRRAIGTNFRMGIFAANWLVERINRDYVREAAALYGRGRVLDVGCGR